MGILNQTINLIVASLPTTIIAFIFFLFARAVFFGPMGRVLDERTARTEGARSDAARLDGQAQEKMNAYHRALDKVRTEVYSAQESARRAALDERAALLRENRARANERVREAKDRLEKEMSAVRDNVEAGSQRLAEDVVRAVLAETSPAGLAMDGD